MDEEPSIFRKYFEPEALVDRFASRPEGAVDVIVPAAHSNELWRKNLIALYREVPVRRLLIGDGGCVDQTLDVAREFPRVAVLDHRAYASLGFSIRKLIEAVETEWFVYLHSDVYLPPGWFEQMARHQARFDWFECRQRLTVLLEYPLDEAGASRPYSGSQMGRTAAFREILPRIEDDYLYRNEDVVIASLLERAGHRYGHVTETFHYHQQMPKKSRWERKARVTVEPSREEEVRELTMQTRGAVKYLDPSPERAAHLEAAARRLEELGSLQPLELDAWVARTDPRWLSFLRRERRKLVLVNAWQAVLSLKASVQALGRLLAGVVAARRSPRPPGTPEP